jgi:hypothetical protein
MKVVTRSGKLQLRGHRRSYDTLQAYLMEVEAELADPGPGQSLAAASGLSARDTLLTGLAENLDLKNDNPSTVPVNGWLAWRTANREDGPRP